MIEFQSTLVLYSASLVPSPEISSVNYIVIVSIIIFKSIADGSAYANQ